MSHELHSHAIGAWIAIGAASLCLLTAGGAMTTTDAVVAYDVTRSIVEQHSVATSRDVIGNEAYRGRDGRYYSPFGIAQSVWNIPFFLLGRTVASRSSQWSATGDTVPKAVVALATVPAVALLCWISFELLTVLGAAPTRAVVTVLLLLIGTPLWPYSRFGFNQPLAALFLWGAILGAITGLRPRRTSLVASGILVGLAVLTRHEMLGAAVILGVFVWLRSPKGPAPAAWYIAGLMPPLVTWALLNWWRFGNPLESGYLRDPTPGFGSSIAAGVGGLLFSPYASIFLYCPLALLSVAGWRALSRRHAAVTILFVTMVGAYVLLYASLGNWMGGRSYGPRYLVPFLPALVLPLAFWYPQGRMRVLAAAIAVASVIVQLPGVLVDYSKVRMAGAVAGDTVAQDLRWSGAPLLLNARAVVGNAPRVLAHLTGAEPVPRVTLQDLLRPTGLPFGLDFWWLHLLYVGALGRGATLAIVLGLMAASLLAFTRALALARHAPTVKAWP